MDIQTTHAIVLDVLHRASSQDPSILKPAETKLMEWETEAGFYTVLNVSIICDFLYYFHMNYFSRRILFQIIQ